MTKQAATTTLGFLLALALTASRADAQVVPDGATVPFTVTITKPTAGASFPANTKIDISAKVQYDYTKISIKSVEFTIDGGSNWFGMTNTVVSSGNNTATTTWTPSKTGTYTITVKATASDGSTATASVNVTITP